jgi:hypothetical protein
MSLGEVTNTTICFTGRKKKKTPLFFLRPVKWMVILVTYIRNRSPVSIKACRFIYCRSYMYGGDFSHLFSIPENEIRYMDYNRYR